MDLERGIETLKLNPDDRLLLLDILKESNRRNIPVNLPFINPINILRSEFELLGEYFYTVGNNLLNDEHIIDYSYTPIDYLYTVKEANNRKTKWDKRINRCLYIEDSVYSVNLSDLTDSLFSNFTSLYVSATIMGSNLDKLLELDYGSLDDLSIHLKDSQEESRDFLESFLINGNFNRLRNLRVSSEYIDDFALEILSNKNMRALRNLELNVTISENGKTSTPIFTDIGIKKMIGKFPNLLNTSLFPAVLKEQKEENVKLKLNDNLEVSVKDMMVSVNYASNKIATYTPLKTTWDGTTPRSP